MINKILVLLFFASSTCFSQNWIVVNESIVKIEIDISSIKKDENKIYSWIKYTYINKENRDNYINEEINFIKDSDYLSTKNKIDKSLKFKEFYYNIEYRVFDIKNKKSQLLQIIYYSKEGNVIDRYKYEEKYSEYNLIIPESRGMLIFESLIEITIDRLK